MPHAFLTPTGHIREIVAKPSPFMRLAEGERMVRCDPPAIDEELQTAVPIEPVPQDAQSVSFAIQDLPAEAVNQVLRRRATDAVQAHMDARAT